MKHHLLILAFASSTLSYNIVIADNASDNQYTCWDDMSWAINTPEVSEKLGQRETYHKFLRDCEQTAGTHYCERQENWRMQMNMYQPRSVYNYTESGYFKMRAPDHILNLINDFWTRNRNEGVLEWADATTYHNNWAVPTYMVHMDNSSLPGGGPSLQVSISNAAREIIEEWTGMRQAISSVYGVRIYHNQSILAPHVDRLPLVSSCIINVDQDVEVDWPLEIYDHFGNGHNITMRPGDMLFYESHSVIHGRPFPLQGNFYANIFIHFEPFAKLNEPIATFPYREALPPYLIAESSWEPEWREMNPSGWDLLQNPWKLAERGDLYTLKYLLTVDPSQLHRYNVKGWQPLFFACKQGHLEVVKFLVEKGAKVNAISTIRPYRNPLMIADEYLGKDSSVSQYLRQQGARAEIKRMAQNAAAAYATSARSEF